MNWMRLPATKATKTIRVMNLDQAHTILKMAKDEPYVVYLDTYDHTDEPLNWVWSADYMRSIKWTINYGWDCPSWSDDYGAIRFVAHHKGRRHMMTIQKFGWDWSQRVLGSKYWEETV
jgi:hypothetical protein